MALAKLPSTAAFGRRAAGDVAAEDGCSRSGSAHVFFKYIQPCSPVTAKTVPTGDDWQHEIKFDGFRVQAHIIGKTVELYSRSGGKFSRRFPRLASVFGELPTRSAIIDGEIVASDAAGMPDFWPLFLHSAKPAELHVWAFDLLALDGKDLRKLPLERRQARLQTLLKRFACPTVLASESFNDGQALLQVAEKHGLEGVVSKRRGAPYKSGACRRWRKIKTTAWREANRERWRLFSSEVDLLRNSQSRCSNRQERTGEII
jgi:bifunctional non-homologous end joining protein LigD